MIRIMETKKDDSIVLNESLPFFAVHPGYILKEELKERGIKQKDFAGKIGMEASHLSALIHGTRNVTAAIAERLEKGLGIPAYLWLNLQNRFNLSKKHLEEGDCASLVNGYSVHINQSLALREPVLNEYGNRKSVLISLPVSDLALLVSFAERLGWDLQD